MSDPLPRIPIGARRRRFVLERPVEESDGFGGTLRRFVPGPLLWGSLEAIGAPERVRGGRADAVETHRVRLAYRPDVSPPMRLAAGPRRFAIRAAADPDGRGRELVCRVEELIAGAEAP
ncbi:phage head closure protein [Methylobacterium gossipiicola]|uniref:Phage head-tail adaptor, putative, SPP1 family n=1 Tax=Methylobacterium gossipiicola TaxID=582675 RepID=A0A1I2RYM6_9HYPH|nr:phage head closure protein [Methylobacterium gossipiicola]SFG42871.1 phage head-tail adaptor, putative, SPP1 family [Methylobacterium gossipiicola]